MKKEWAVPNHHIRPQNQFNAYAHIWVREGRPTPTTCLTAIHIFYLHLLNLVAVPTRFHSKANDETNKKNTVLHHSHSETENKKRNNKRWAATFCVCAWLLWFNQNTIYQVDQHSRCGKSSGRQFTSKKNRLSESSTRVQDKNDYIRHVSKWREKKNIVWLWLRFFLFDIQIVLPILTAIAGYFFHYMMKILILFSAQKSILVRCYKIG